MLDLFEIGGPGGDDAYSTFKDKERFIALSPQERIRVFVRSGIFNRIAIVFGLGFGTLAILLYGIKIADDGSSLFNSILNKQGVIGMIPLAYAEEAKHTAQGDPIAPKNVIIFLFCLALLVLFLWSLYTLSKSTSPKAIDTAADAVKTLAGFFIGAVTGFLG